MNEAKYGIRNTMRKGSIANNNGFRSPAAIQGRRRADSQPEAIVDVGL